MSLGPTTGVFFYKKKLRGVIWSMCAAVLHSFLSEVDELYSTVNICHQHLSGVFML